MIARHLALLAYIKSQHPYAVVTAQIFAEMREHYNNSVVVRNDLNRLFDAGYVYNSHRDAGIQFYWKLSDVGYAYFGLPVPKREQAT